MRCHLMEMFTHNRQRSEMLTLNSLIRNMKDTFQLSGDIFWNATYFIINIVNMLQNALTQDKLLTIDLYNLE